MRCCTPAAGHEALRMIANAAPDLIVLDLGLPDIDGKEVIDAGAAIHRRRRSSSSRRATARRRRSRRSTSAPTTMSKSPSPSANCSPACAPPCGTPKPAAAPKTRVEVDGLVIDMDRRLVARDGAPIKLTPREYDLLVHAGGQRRAGDDPRPDPHRRLGPRAQGRHAVSARVRRPIARQDRARPSAADDHPHRVRGSATASPRAHSRRRPRLAAFVRSGSFCGVASWARRLAPWAFFRLGATRKPYCPLDAASTLSPIGQDTPTPPSPQ